MEKEGRKEDMILTAKEAAERGGACRGRGGATDRCRRLSERRHPMRPIVEAGAMASGF